MKPTNCSPSREWWTACSWSEKVREYQERLSCPSAKIRKSDIIRLWWYVKKNENKIQDYLEFLLFLSVCNTSVICACDRHHTCFMTFWGFEEWGGEDGEVGVSLVLQKWFSYPRKVMILFRNHWLISNDNNDNIWYSISCKCLGII